jgi:outer membrane protein TolC
MSLQSFVAGAGRRSPLVAAALLLSIGPLALAAEPPLSLSEAVRIGVAQSPQLASQQAMVAAAREMAVPARELPDPKLIAGVENVPISGADAFTFNRDAMTMARLGIMQDFPRAEKRELRGRRAEREAARSAAQVAVSAAAVRREIAAAWMARYYAEAIDRAIVAQVGETELAIEAASAAYRAGRGSQSELIAMQAMKVDLANRRADAAMQRERARVALARYVGHDADRPLDDAPDVQELPFDAAALADADRQPEVRLARAQEDLAAAEAGIARIARKPDWSAEVTYGLRGMDNASMVSLMVRIDLPWSPATRQEREYAAKLKEQDAARAMREDTERMRTADVQQMLVEWRTARAQAARMRDELLPLARQRIDATLAAYRANTGTLTAVLDARRADLDARVALINMELAAAKAWAWLANVVVPEGQS